MSDLSKLCNGIFDIDEKIAPEYEGGRQDGHTRRAEDQARGRESPGRAAAAGGRGGPGPGRGEGQAHGSPLVGPRWPDRVGPPAPGIFTRPAR